MSQLLVYTQNLFIKKTISSLMIDPQFVTFFHNRVQFIACATVLKNSILIIDTLSADSGSINWINSRIKLKKLKNEHYFIVPLHISQHALAKAVSIISDIPDLKTVCQSVGRKPRKIQDRNIVQIILERVQKRLSDTEYELFLTLCSCETQNKVSLTRKEANARYYIRKKKLDLDNAIEFKQLLLMISQRCDLHN